MEHIRGKFTVLPFLVAMLLAPFGMVGHVFLVNRGEMGIEHGAPWRGTALETVASVGRTLMARTRAAVAALGRHAFEPAVLVAAAALVAAVVLPSAGDVLLATAGVMGLAAARDKAAEIDAKINGADTRINEIDQEIGAIAAAATKGKRAMTEEENTKLASLRAEKKTQQEFKAVFLAEQAEHAPVLRAAQERNEAERRLGSQPDPDASAAARARQAAGLPAVVAGRENAEDDPKRGFRDQREFCQKVFEAGRTGKIDARLKPLAAAGSDEAGGHSDPHGAFLLPIAFSPDMLKVQTEGDPTAPLTRKLPMDAPMVKVDARVDKNHNTSVSGGLRVYRHAETAELTSSRQEFEKLSFDANELMGLALATESQISDSPYSFVAMIADGFKDEFGAKLLQEKLSGTGAGGQYLGALTSPALITIAKENAQAAATILVENIDKMAARCWRYNSERTVYLANPTTRPQLRGLVRNIGTGGNVVNYFTQDGGVERLDGRLIFFTEFAKTLGTIGDLVLINLSEYIEGQYQGMQQAESVHVRFVNHERALKFWVRNCGMPWWRSALTPKNGDTLSPIVALATRA